MFCLGSGPNSFSPNSSKGCWVEGEKGEASAWSEAEQPQWLFQWEVNGRRALLYNLVYKFRQSLASWIDCHCMTPNSAMCGTLMPVSAGLVVPEMSIGVLRHLAAARPFYLDIKILKCWLNCMFWDFLLFLRYLVISPGLSLCNRGFINDSDFAKPNLGKPLWLETVICLSLWMT